MNKQKSKKVHFYHEDKRIIGDVMPFYHDGEYHFFYLLNGSGHQNINHEHSVSKDLINFTQLPHSIIKDNGNLEEIDNGCMFTGCYLKDNSGLFHCFYTSWNPLNPNGREFIRHAISKDLIHFEKIQTIISPDPRYYSTARFRDFRDPCVIFDQLSGYYYMFILANKINHDNDANSWDENWVTGLYKSRDLYHWEALPPLSEGLNDECPDYFEMGGKHYLLGCKKYVVSDHRFGPYKLLEHHHFDLPTFRAAKTCFDGKRRLWIGGFGGGPFNLPREIVQLDDSSLGLKLVDEIYKQFRFDIEEIAASSNILIEEAVLIRITYSINDVITLMCLPSGSTIIIDTLKKDVLVTQQDGYSFTKKLRCKAEGRIDILIENNLIEAYINDIDVVSVNTKINIESVCVTSNQAPLTIKVGKIT